MANKETEELTAAATLDGTELVHVVQSGNSRRTTVSGLAVINPLTGKTTPVDADEIRIADSAASFAPKKLTFANLKAWIRSWLPISSVYTSAEQTITSAGALTLAHGLGVKPSLLTFTLICKTAEHGYSVDDELYLGPVGTATSIDDNRAFSAVVDGTNVNIRFGANASTFSLLSRSSGAGVALTNANWRLIVRAFG